MGAVAQEEMKHGEKIVKQRKRKKAKRERERRESQRLKRGRMKKSFSMGTSGRLDSLTKKKKNAFTKRKKRRKKSRGRDYVSNHLFPQL